MREDSDFEISVTPAAVRVQKSLQPGERQQRGRLAGTAAAAKVGPITPQSADKSQMVL